eukprot:1084871-Pleurochrysis_carterae.AAC.1
MQGTHKHTQGTHKHTQRMHKQAHRRARTRDPAGAPACGRARHTYPYLQTNTNIHASIQTHLHAFAHTHAGAHQRTHCRAAVDATCAFDERTRRVCTICVFDVPCAMCKVPCAKFVLDPACSASSVCFAGAERTSPTSLGERPACVTAEW